MSEGEAVNMNYIENDGSINTDKLITYLEDKHNKELRQLLNDATGLLYTILRVHGGHHRELYELYSVFGGLKAVLEQHMVKEEILLFPDLDEYDEDKENMSLIAEELRTDHETIVSNLSRIREITDGYKIPKDVCMTFEKTYLQLKDIDKNLSEYIEIEKKDLLREI